MLHGVGLGFLMPALTKDGVQHPRPQATALFDLSRPYGSKVRIALVRTLDLSKKSHY
jgi:hypothetical protein